MSGASPFRDATYRDKLQEPERVVRFEAKSESRGANGVSPTPSARSTSTLKEDADSEGPAVPTEDPFGLAINRKTSKSKKNGSSSRTPDSARDPRQVLPRGSTWNLRSRSAVRESPALRKPSSPSPPDPAVSSSQGVSSSEAAWKSTSEVGPRKIFPSEEGANYPSRKSSLSSVDKCPLPGSIPLLEPFDESSTDVAAAFGPSVDPSGVHRTADVLRSGAIPRRECATMHPDDDDAFAADSSSRFPAVVPHPFAFPLTSALQTPSDNNSGVPVASSSAISASAAEPAPFPSMRARLVSRHVVSSTPIHFDDVEMIVGSIAHSPISSGSPSPPPPPQLPQHHSSPQPSHYYQNARPSAPPLMTAPRAASPLSRSTAAISAAGRVAAAPSSLSTTMTTMLMETSQTVEAYATGYPVDSDEILRQELEVVTKNHIQQKYVDYLLEKLGRDLEKFSGAFLHEICQKNNVAVSLPAEGVFLLGVDEVDAYGKTAFISKLKDHAVEYLWKARDEDKGGFPPNDAELRQFKMFIDEFASPLYSPLPSFLEPGSRNGRAENEIVWSKSETKLYFYGAVRHTDPAFANPCFLEAVRCGFYRRRYDSRQDLFREKCPKCRQYKIVVRMTDAVWMRPTSSIVDGDIAHQMDPPMVDCPHCNSSYLIVDICVGRPALRSIDPYEGTGVMGGSHCFICPLVAESFGRCNRESSFVHCCICQGHFHSKYQFCPLCKNI